MSWDRNIIILILLLHSVLQPTPQCPNGSRMMNQLIAKNAAPAHRQLWTSHMNTGNSSQGSVVDSTEAIPAMWTRSQQITTNSTSTNSPSGPG